MEGEHKGLKFLAQVGAVIVAVVGTTLVIDSRYERAAQAETTHTDIKSRIAQTAKTQAAYNEIAQLETQIKLHTLELNFLNGKPQQTKVDLARVSYLQSSISMMENRILLLRGDLARGG